MKTSKNKLISVSTNDVVNGILTIPNKYYLITQTSRGFVKTGMKNLDDATSFLNIIRDLKSWQIIKVI